MKTLHQIFTAILVLSIVGGGFAAEPVATDRMRADVRQLIDAAKKMDRLWPWSDPLPEVAVVARHGPAVAPLLVAELVDEPDNPDAHPDVDVNWNVQQQVALALCRIYGVPDEPGTVYMNRAPAATNATIKAFWVRKVFGK